MHVYIYYFLVFISLYIVLIVIAPSNVHCFHEIMKNWPKDTTKKDQFEFFNKDLRPTLSINNVDDDEMICGRVDRRKAFSFISSRDHFSKIPASQISDTSRAGFEPVQNLSSGFIE